MRTDLLPLLACPYDPGAPLALKKPEPGTTPDEVERGLLACGRCGRRYPILGGIPRLLPDPLRDLGGRPGAGEGDPEWAGKASEMRKRDAEAPGYARHVGAYRTWAEPLRIGSRFRCRPSARASTASRARARSTWSRA